MTRALTATFLLWSAACATAPRPVLAVAAGDPAALAQAAERFYGAATVQTLREAVAQAALAGPGSAVAHELAARLAQLEGNEAATVDHMLAALGDRGDDAPVLHLHHLMSLDLTAAQRARVRALLRVLAAEHPSPDLRSLAAHHLAGLLNEEGLVAERAEVLARIPSRLDFAVVGTWDNDQGKGYDLELPPESQPGLDQAYEGRAIPLTWRQHAPVDPRGRLDLAALMAPTRWAVAFAQAEVSAPADGPYALRMTSSDPVKVWVDGRLLFATSQLERPLWEQLVLPLSLKAGAHRVLVKSAHKEGLWFLSGRLAPVDASDAVATIDDAMRWHVRGLPPGSARQAAHLWDWASLAAGGTTPVKLADAWVRAAPTSIVARASLVDALWHNQERGRAADTLQALDEELGLELPLVRLRQIRFHQQQGLKQKARARLLTLTKERPDVKEAVELLAEAYRTEGWTEDELRVERELRARFSPTEEDSLEFARSLVRIGRRGEAVEVYEALLAALPGSGAVLRALAELELEAGHLARAEALYRRRLDTWPVDSAAWLLLAETRRRMDDDAGARRALDEATALSPLASAPFVKRGDLAWALGNSAAALKQWRQALDFNPENDSLANRIDFVAPEARGPWMADVPDEAVLDRSVKLREGLKAQPGADVAWLLDHEVTLLNSDGSTSNVVTHVVHAFSAQGRDRIIRQAIPSGRLRVLHAYSVDEKGQRSEASSERSRQIFFRAMQPGSTLVLQYRLDAPPRGFLSRFWAEQWSFQGSGDQRVESTFVLWAPLGTTLHERRVGTLERTQEKRGEQLRFGWSAKDVPPLLYEPSMPGARELATNVTLSTVPDWKTWLSWEQALLDGVFRDSPEVDAVAKKLGEGADSGDEKLKRIHQYVMEEIRYQQDYETFIAGVKPHAAPMVLERRYGDCKDKAVLFITLARKLGLEAQFALVRTRDGGPVETEVPSQQFNHAIVYVPDQPGVTAGRFFDPTADLLDLEAVRYDDVGTKSLVFDPITGTHTWRDIAFQAPEVNLERNTLKLALGKDGGARGTYLAEGTGRSGATFRQLSRNTEVMAQVFQRTIGSVVSGGSVSNLRVKELSLRKPAQVEMDLEAPALARPEADALRLRLPTDVSPRRSFALATRKHPLLLGTPSAYETELELTLPEGFEVKRLPASGALELPCLSLSRTVAATEDGVRSSQRFLVRCERLSPAEYAQYRAKADEMARLLDDELVLGPRAAPAPPKAPPVRHR